MNEEQLENQCLDWFREKGWEVAHGPDIAPDGDTPEREDYRQVALKGQLRNAVSHINPHLPDDCVEQAVGQALKPESPDPIISNRAFHRMLLEGVPVGYKRDDETVYDRAFLIDFENVTQNRFLVVNQFTAVPCARHRRGLSLH